MKTSVRFSTACLALTGLMHSADAAPGNLDPTFGGTGIVTTQYGTYSQAEGMTMQSDGKIVVAALFGGIYDFGIVRYNADGTLDTSLNGTGIAVTSFSTGQDYPSSVAEQADHRIVVAGTSTPNEAGALSHLTVVRYLPNGSLDTSFNGTGVFMSSSGNDHGNAVAIQPDGKIVVAGEYGRSDILVARFNPNGQLDGSFGGGRVLTSVNGLSCRADSIALQSDGKIIVAGYTDTNGETDFALVRYHPSGALDESFGRTGKVTTDFGSYDSAARVAVQHDGKIIAGGTKGVDNEQFALARYNSDGSLDSSFNATGTVLTSIGASGTAMDLAIQRDGKLVVAGSTYTAGKYFGVVTRYHSDGSLDQTFNGTGIRTFGDAMDTTTGNSVVVQRDGRIVVAGHSQRTSGSGGILVARFEGDRIDSLLGPVIQVEQPPATPLGNGAGRYIGGVVPGGAATMRFSIYNPGTEPLDVSGITIAGPDAAAFQISEAAASVVPPEGVTNFTVRFASVGAGTKTATLHIATNDIDNSPFAVALSGTAYPAPVPDITVEQPSGSDLPDGGARNFGIVNVRSTTSMNFTIRNQGVSDLTGLTFSKDGPAAAMFSVMASPVVPLNPGGATSFIVQFTPTTTGDNTATLHIASNDPDENPFDIVLSGTSVPGPGDPDPTFNCATNGTVNCIAVQPPGKIFIGGSFTMVNGVPRNNIARVLQSGALDTSFSYSAAGAINTIALQLDSGIVIGGSFGLAKLNANGTSDPGFTSIVNPPVYSLGLQPDNKIIFLGGGIGRVTVDGKSDPNFTPVTEYRDSLAVYGTGSFVASGRSYVGANAFITSFARDGTATSTQYFYGPGRPQDDVQVRITSLLQTGYGYEGGWDSNPGRQFFGSPRFPGQTSGRNMVGQTDGKTIFAGGIRVHANGTLDTTFAASSGGSNAMSIQADGGILVDSGGSLKRLLNDPATQSLAVPDPQRVQWLRGGSSPVAILVAFDLSTDGGANWISLGTGTSVTDGWVLTGLNLPGSGRLRARARTASSRSYGLVESVTDYTVTPVPEIVIAQTPGSELTSGSATPVDFGLIPPANTASRTFTIYNKGWGDLTGIAVTKATDGTPGDFAIGTPGVTTLAHNDDAIFTVTFSPAGPGVRTATLLIASNDADENPFAISLTGTGATSSEIWRMTYFGSFANTGPGADLSDPDGDSIVNLLEYATATDPLVPTLFPGKLVKNGSTLEFTYTRRKAALTEMSFVREFSETLTGAWSTVAGTVETILSDDGVLQQVKTTVPAGSTGKRFLRLRVIRR